MAASSQSLAGHRDLPGFGITVFIGNLAIMALLGAGVRELLGRGYPLAEVLLLRFTFASLIFWGVLLTTVGFAGLATRRPIDHAIRGFSGVFSLGLLYFALSRIPLADATAIAYAAPIFITVLAIFLLGETIGIRRWLAVIAGFAGVVLIAQPGGSGWDIGMLAAAGSAFGGAFVAIWLRKLSSSERSVTIGVYYNSLGTLICAGWMIWSGGRLPGIDDAWLLAGFALGCGLQQWLLTISFRYAEASLLAPFENLAMVFAAIVGFLVWGEVPALTTWLGAAVIAASALFILRRGRARQSAEEAPRLE